MIAKLLILYFVGIISIFAYSDLEGEESFFNFFYDEEENGEILRDGRNCTKAGFMCENCTHVSYCIEMPGGTFLKEENVDVCKDKATCLETTGTCTTDSNPSCDPAVTNYTFICHQVGIYPDPFNCFKYHICQPDGNGIVLATSLKRFCTGGFYYNSLTTLCSLKSVNNTCPPVAPVCTSVGQQGVIKQNPSLYYVCLKTGDLIFPQIFLCIHDKKFDGKECKDPVLPQEPAGSDGLCKARGYFFNDTNCFYYNECDAPGLAPVSHSCPTKQYFNTTISYCADFTCKNV